MADTAEVGNWQVAREYGVFAAMRKVALLMLALIALRFIALIFLPLLVKLRIKTQQEASNIHSLLALDAMLAIVHSDKYSRAKRRREAAAYAE